MLVVRVASGSMKTLALSVSMIQKVSATRDGNL